VGDGVFNAAHKIVVEAVEDRKRPLVAVYGPSGCGKSSSIACIAYIYIYVYIYIYIYIYMPQASRAYAEFVLLY
jgi:ABC-type taurine transport system ATPase subunit